MRKMLEYCVNKMGKDGLIHAKDAVCVARFNKLAEVIHLVPTPEHGAEADIARIVDLIG